MSVSSHPSVILVSSSHAQALKSSSLCFPPLFEPYRICFIVYGINIYQVVDYYHTFGKRDPLLTKAWVLSVMIMNSTSSFYQVYYEWIFSITSFEANTTDAPSVASGNVVVLYSVVVM